MFILHGKKGLRQGLPPVRSPAGKDYASAPFLCNLSQLWIICNQTGSVFNGRGGADTLITYDKLWETMKEKEITQYRLIKYYGFSAGQLGRLKKNMYVSTHTIETLCSILDCRVEDIIEYKPDSAG
ncbi:MAG: helix-turn-helix transcriptional regulator [Clostridium sp.]|nr:helix-turn-helix transcriptional regulator [Clostridium sp.]